MLGHYFPSRVFLRGVVAISRCREVDVAALVKNDLKGSSMKLALLVCAALMVLAFPSTSSADDLADVTHGNGLFSALSRCPDIGISFGKDKGDNNDWQDCVHATSYILGVIDALQITLPIQIPDAVTNAQKWDIVHAYLKKHANYRHLHSVNLIYDALLEAFPPPKGK
jgi:Rap1a immunity proteins